jgi:hypothetical protein
MSLFWINGILSWQLTPGTWLETRSVWAGFFNPGFLPSLIFRTISAAAIASLAACTLVNAVPGFTREERQTLVGVCARPLAFMLAMPLVGAWYLGTMPADSRGWATGGSVPMTLFLTMAVGSSTLIGLYAVLAILRQRLFVNGATASLLLALAFVATAGGEFVREGVRKPFTIRESGLARDERTASILESSLSRCMSARFARFGWSSVRALGSRRHRRRPRTAGSRCGAVTTPSGRPWSIRTGNSVRPQSLRMRTRSPARTPSDAACAGEIPSSGSGKA